MTDRPSDDLSDREPAASDATAETHSTAETHTTAEAAASTRPARGTRIAALVAAGVALVVVAVVAFSFGRLSTLAEPTPGDRSADAGFSRDMQVHHLQGVDMAMIIRGISDADDMQHLSYDLATTQAQQAGQMYGWLEEWGLSQYDPDPMAWMAAEGGHAHGGADAPGEADSTGESMLTEDGLMPGMATDEQLDELRAATGVEAERLFLELMIAHHRGAVEMAEAALELADAGVVLRLASSVVESQEAEISLMERMLADRA